MQLNDGCALAAFFYFIGAAVWCDDEDDSGSAEDASECNSYTMTLNLIGSFLVAAGGVFLLLSVFMGGSSSTSPA